jgi:hypothetical protein
LINTYSSPYRNYLHQLFVTPSKHLYLLNDGRLKWQKKALEVTLKNVDQPDKEHVIYYLVADHHSSAFYAEVLTAKTQCDPIEFLKRAWQKKSNFFFSGFPEKLMLPTGVHEKYPELIAYAQSNDVSCLAPPSGFAAGIHQIRNWEKDIASAVRFETFSAKKQPTLAGLAKSIRYALNSANDQVISRPGLHLSRRALWERADSVTPPLRFS